MSMDAITPSPQVREAAEIWFARLRAPECTAAERVAFESWCMADPGHAAAYAATERLWAKLGALKDAPEVRAYELEALTPARRARPPAFQRRRWVIPAALAAALGLVAVGLWLAPQLMRPEPPQIYATADQSRTLTLTDGSTVQLDVATHVSVQMTGKARAIELAQGRALFDVAHDAQRPFTVVAADGSVTALGTRFQVQRDAGRVTVTLAEGVVAVHRDAVDGQGEQQTRLQPGDQLTYSRQQAGWDMRRVNLEAAISWTQGRLMFRGTPLAEAVAEINRYSARKIRLADPGLDKLRLSGTFRAGNVQSIAGALPAVLPVRVVDQPGNDILLYSR